MEEALRAISLSIYSNETVSLDVLRAAFESLDTDFINNEELQELADRLAELEAEGGEPNVIETIKVNGVPVQPEGKTVNIEVPTGETLTPEEKEKVQSLPEFEGNEVPNGVTTTEDGKLEVYSITPDKVQTGGYVFVLDGGKAAPKEG